MLALGLVSACSGPPAPAHPAAPPDSRNRSEADTPARAGQAAPGDAVGLLAGTFGGARWGFVEASSRNGRVVFIRSFPGKDKPSFGHHGESFGATPELHAFDRVTGQERRVTELIEIDATRRWFLVLHDEWLWLVDGHRGAWTRLEDVDMESDGNACLPPRQASFSPSGNRAGWVSSDAVLLHVRDLDTGEQWTVAAEGALWRGWPDDDGRGAVLIEIAADQAGDQAGWPQQRTTCACRWCSRFAASYGFYGWGGPPFKTQHIKEDGSREAGTPPERDAPFHGPTDTGCKLAAADGSGGLDLGPWRWDCAKATGP